MRSTGWFVLILATGLLVLVLLYLLYAAPLLPVNR